MRKKREGKKPVTFHGRESHLNGTDHYVSARTTEAEPR